MLYWIVGEQATRAAKCTLYAIKDTPCSVAHGCLPKPTCIDHAATGGMMPSAEVRGMGKEAAMAMRHGTAHLFSGRQDMLLVILLLLVFVAALVLAANTPWVLDQPLPPYDWAIVP